MDTLVVDVDRSDRVDASALVEAVVPVRAEPASGIESIDVSAGAFLGVRAGTRLEFSVRLRNDLVEPTNEPQRFEVEIVFRADGRNRIGSVRLEVVVPSLDGTGCGG